MPCGRWARPAQVASDRFDVDIREGQRTRSGLIFAELGHSWIKASALRAGAPGRVRVGRAALAADATRRAGQSGLAAQP